MEYLKATLSLLVKLAILAGIVLAILNRQKISDFFNWGGYRQVDFSTLVSYGNFYDTKNVCTRAFYLQTPQKKVLAINLKSSDSGHEIWVENPTGNEVISSVDSLPQRAVDAQICGKFEKGRNSFGNSSLWNFQLTVDHFQTYGDAFSFDAGN